MQFRNYSPELRFIRGIGIDARNELFQNGDGSIHLDVLEIVLNVRN